MPIQRVIGKRHYSDLIMYICKYHIISLKYEYRKIQNRNKEKTTG